MQRLALVAAFAAVLLSACSSDSSGSSGTSGSSGSSGSTNPDCAFSGSLSGGVTGSIAANGCGTSPSSIFTIAQADLVGGTSLGVKFELVTALKGGELGAVPLKAFSVFQRESKGTENITWSGASCTLTLDKNEASPTTVFKNRFLLTGHGSCASPLDPVAPNTRPAVTVSLFEMKAFVDP